MSRSSMLLNNQVRTAGFIGSTDVSSSVQGVFVVALYNFWESDNFLQEGVGVREGRINWQV